ncbi:MAG: hypothetical protein GWO20_10280 [Candidatus Korarchaeota archaeon]|nr:hypothetical protein [Candidatus Korarchaeota archaeon]
MSFLELLPFRIEKADDLAKAFEKLEEGNLLLRAPPGSGKTAVSLAYLLRQARLGRKSVIFFRTKAEIDQGLMLLNEMVEPLNEKPLITPLVGKKEACLYPPAEETALRWWCKFSNCGRMNRKWKRGLEEDILTLEGRGLSIDRYLDELRKQGLCPFYALRKLATRSVILLTTYPFLIDGELFKKINERDLFILDEAHTMLCLVTHEMKKGAFKRGEQLFARTEDEEMPPNRYCVSLWRQGKKEDAVMLSQYLAFQKAAGSMYETRENMLKVCPPSRLLAERVEAEKLLVMSSTLYPSGLFKKIFAIARMHLLEGMLTPSNKRAIIGLTSHLTSRYTMRSREMFKRYAEAIQTLTDAIDVPTLLFSPSYRFASRLAKHLGYPVTREETEIPKHLASFGQVHTVARGRLSEGIDIDLSGEEPRLLIVAGLPFPKISDRMRAVAREYGKEYDISEGHFLRALTHSTMVSALTQMIGRTGRTKKGAAVIMDERLRNLNLPFPTVHSLSSVIKRVRQLGIGQQITDVGG